MNMLILQIIAALVIYDIIKLLVRAIVRVATKRVAPKLYDEALAELKRETSNKHPV